MLACLFVRFKITRDLHVDRLLGAGGMTSPLMAEWATRASTAGGTDASGSGL